MANFMADDTQKLVRSVLQSCKDGVPLRQLEHDYKCVTGDKIPFSDFGYSSLESYLRSIPQVVRLTYGPRGQMVEAVPDKNTEHIAALVAHQKRAKTKSNKKPQFGVNSFAIPPRFKTKPIYKPAALNINEGKKHSVQTRTITVKQPMVNFNPWKEEVKKPVAQIPTSNNGAKKPAVQISTEINKHQTAISRSYADLKNQTTTISSNYNNLKMPFSQVPLYNDAKKPIQITTTSIYNDKWQSSNGSGNKKDDVRVVKETHTSYKQMLEQYVKSRDLGVPIFSLLPMPGSAGQLATVKVCGHSFSSYPTENLSPDEAQELAAKKAIETLGSRTDTDQTTVSTEVEVVFSRIKKILQNHPQGVISDQIPIWYKEEYKENLPDGWLKIILERNITPYEKVNEDKVILYPEADSEVIDSLNLSPTATTDSEDSVATSTASTSSNELWEVFLCHAVSTTKVFIRRVETSEKFDELAIKMEAVYSCNKQNVTCDIVVGQLYAAYFEESWHRVKIISVHNYDKVLCQFVDNGDYDYVTKSNIQILRAEFFNLPEQAIKCQLLGLEEYATNATAIFRLQNERGKTFVAEVKQRDNTFFLVLYDTQHDENINVNETIKSQILEADITPSLPNTGIVCDKSVHLSHVLPEGNIYVQIQNACYDFVEELLNIIRENCDEHLASVTREDIKIGESCYIAKYEQEWYRARIVQFDGNKVEVFFIDYGNSEKVPIEDIKNLYPVHELLPIFPPLAFKCKLFGIPSSEDLEWTTTATQKLSELVLDEKVLLKVVIPASTNTIPAVEIFKRIQPDNQLIAIKETLMIDQDLFRLKQTQCNNSSLQICKMNILEPPQLPAIDSFMDVQVTLAASPSNFRCQPRNTYHIFEELTAAMQDYYNNDDNLVEVNAESVEVGEHYACNHCVDKLWYRVQVKGYDAKISVISLYYIDFGDTYVSSFKDIQPLPNKFRNLPYQAISCKLFGVCPTNKDWRPEDCVRFQQSVVNRNFVAQVCKIHSDEELLTIEVKLIDTSNEIVDVDIGQVLIDENRGVPTND